MIPALDPESVISLPRQAREHASSSAAAVRPISISDGIGLCDAAVTHG
jgi:hypothetical protein